MNPYWTKPGDQHAVAQAALWPLQLSTDQVTRAAAGSHCYWAWFVNLLRVAVGLVAGGSARKDATTKVANTNVPGLKTGGVARSIQAKKLFLSSLRHPPPSATSSTDCPDDQGSSNPEQDCVLGVPAVQPP